MSPRISVLTAVYNPDRDHLQACIDSVREQVFDDYEHIIVDDASTQPFVAELLEAAAAADPRVRVARRDTNGGIVAASNDALAAAGGELIALLDHDDVLEPDALAVMSAEMTGDVDVAYSDHDLIRPDGRYITPSYKPDFSPERLRSQNYITHLLVARRSLVDKVGGFREGFDGAQDHDLVLRLTERAGAVAHVPRILYHWRQSPRSVTTSSDNKPWAFEAGVRAVAAHCERIGVAATIEFTEHEGCYRVRRQITERPLVSVIIPTRGSSGRVWGATRCFVVDAVRSLVERSDYRELEFVVVHDTETSDAVLHHLREIAGDALNLVAFDGPFNFSSKINLGATRANGDLFLLLNDDTELVEPGSLDVLVGHLQMSDVAMVGAKLLFADGTLQHGGHLYNHGIGHACLGWSGESPGPWPLRPLAVDRECSGVTAAAALVRRSAFEEVGGFATELPLNYNDVDFSLKLRAAGHRIVWSPWAIWYHFESRTRHSVLRPEEYEFINLRWHYEINNDPYYNPNLAPDRNDWLERPLRSGAPAIETRPNAVRRLAAGFGSRNAGAAGSHVGRVLRQVAGRRPLRRGVNVVGYFDATSGLGERARELVATLRAGDVAVSEWSVPASGQQLTSSTDENALYDTTIAMVTAMQLADVRERVPRPFEAAHRTIGYFFWELADVPDEQQWGIGLVDEIWAPTRFVADAYRAATQTPVRHVPLPLPHLEPPTARAQGHSTLDVLVSFDLLSIIERKHPFGAIDAFQRAFPASEQVRLVIKTLNGEQRPDGLDRLRAAADADDRIVVRDEHLSREELTELTASSDVLLSLHRSEGLGLHLAEAMAVGTLVIASRYGGNLDFMDDECAALVDVELVDVRNGEGAYEAPARWADPDLDQAAAFLRRALDDPAWSRDLTDRAAARMAASPSRTEIGANLADVLW